MLGLALSLSCSHSVRSYLHSSPNFSPELCPDQHVQLTAYWMLPQTWHILNSTASHSAKLDPSSLFPFSFWHSYLLKRKHQRIIFDSYFSHILHIHSPRSNKPFVKVNFASNPLLLPLVRLSSTAWTIAVNSLLVYPIHSSLPTTFQLLSEWFFKNQNSIMLLILLLLITAVFSTSLLRMKFSWYSKSFTIWLLSAFPGLPISLTDSS